MRLTNMFCIAVALVAISCAQETNFAVGPQYLVNTGSPMFLRPIATPSLSLSAPSSSTQGTEAPASEGSAPAVGSPSQPDLTRVYWGKPGPSELIREAETSTPVPSALPAGIVDVGVTAIADPQSLREQGFGVPLAQAASSRKSHRPHAARIYTNADIQRLPAS